MIILYISIFLFLILLVLSSYLIRNLLYNKRKSAERLDSFNERTFGIEWNTRINSWYEETSRNYFQIQSTYGYPLSCYEIKNDIKKYVIILHGVTTNKEFVRKFAYLYHTLGYSVIAADSRYHGHSGGNNITYGYYEKYDLQKIIDFIKKERGSDTIIGLHGESMGASILLSYASMVDDNCDFYIADCPYASLYDQVLNTLKTTLKTPVMINKFILNFTNFISKSFFGFDIRSIEIKDYISRVNHPILFLNAKNDDYIPTSMSALLFEKCSGNNKEIHWFDTGYHAGSFNYQPDEYIAVVSDFIKKNISEPQN
ncbi:MAG: alpha/beta hydrolase [Clostridia bacterium]|nr:alpha/beta hydrolase [Clostridia bacterium]